MQMHKTMLNLFLKFCFDNQKSKTCPEFSRRIQNRKWVGFLVILLLLVGCTAEAGQAKIYRVGVILQGGVTSTAIDGLRKGLKELGLEEEKHFLLEIRDAKGDLKVAEEAARNLEREKVNLIFAINTSVARVTKGLQQKSLSFSVPGLILLPSGSWTVSRDPEGGSRGSTS
jgi:hypothetical protein